MFSKRRKIISQYTTWKVFFFFLGTIADCFVAVGSVLLKHNVVMPLIQVLLTKKKKKEKNIFLLT